MRRRGNQPTDCWRTRETRASRSPLSWRLCVLALERLFEKELLAKSAHRTFQYRVDLLRHWIRRTHSIWQVVKETGHLPHAGA